MSARRTRLTRRELCQAGLAGLLLGPALAHAKSPLEGLSCEIEVSASSSGLVLELYLINARPAPLHWSEPLHRPTRPNVTLHAGERAHELTLASPFGRRNRPQPRVLRRRRLTLPEGTPDKPSRMHYGRFVAEWPEELPRKKRRDASLRLQALFALPASPEPLQSPLTPLQWKNA